LDDGTAFGVSASLIGVFKRVGVMSIPGFRKRFGAQPYCMNIASSLTLLMICGD
jgi:hypothetical protein